MPITSPKIAFGLYALAIKQDATFSAADKQLFSDMQDLKTGNVASKPFATFEPDYWLLDGSYKLKPTIAHVGLMSLSQSDLNGDFSIPPELTIVFGSVQSSDGLTIRFASASNDYATDIDVAYYDASDVLIRSDSYAPTTWEFSSGLAVDNFKKIIVTFHSTNKAYRYLRVTGVDFGTLIYFEGDAVKSALVVQEVDPISTELPIDTLELSLLSSDANFSIVNPTGNYAALRNNQPLDVYELVNGQTVYMGQFYLSKWENQSRDKIKFDAVDRLGVLSKLTYYGGLWTTPVNAEDLIDEILTAANAPYELDSNLVGTQVSGWIPVTTYRDALQQIAFAIGAYVTCSRAGVLRIYKTDLASEVITPEFVITSADKGLDSTLTLKPFVTGVELSQHNFIITYRDLVTGDPVQFFSGTFPIGTHTIKFDKPQNPPFTVTGATEISSAYNYIIISVAAPGTVTIADDAYYEDVKSIASVYNTTLNSTDPKNVISIDDATLVNSDNAQTIAQRVYDYYQQRYLQKAKLFAPSAEPGKSALIDTYEGKQVKGIVEKMSIDLARGMVTRAEIVGVISA
ncbi:MAG: hypothetical protein IPL32_18080 [Chloracidobacterium sp.]|nr:hypothetical protein [Chloracidobacterium sp.]